MSAPFLSIVIPVYNRPDLIMPCVESIIASHVPDTEILIVDDCSTDNTLEVCRKLAAKCENVAVIPLEKNSGQGHARDMGLCAAKGKYVFFVDSDDEVDPRDFKQLLDRREKWDKADMVVFNYIPHNQTSDQGGYTREDNTYTEERILTGRALAQIYPDKAMWVYLFDREFLLQNELHPFSLAVSEDRLFVCEAMRAAKSLYTSPLHVYHYIRRDGGMSTSKTKMDEWVCFLNWYRNRLVPYEKWDEKPAVKETMERLIVSCSLECSGDLPSVSVKLQRPNSTLYLLCTEDAETAVSVTIQEYIEMMKEMSRGFQIPIYIYPAGATAKRIAPHLIERGIPVSGFIDRTKTGKVWMDIDQGKQEITLFPVEKDCECFTQEACYLICGSTISVDDALIEQLIDLGVKREKIVTFIDKVVIE